ncbi:hypothetical protein A5678_15820 [Mycobacterium sp. E2733]|nr:hypothetical protein A5678_15820 [Mycobacterium sp. E2733]
MSVVRGMPTAVMHVVDVVTVGDRDVATPVAVLMIVLLVHRVARWLTLVVVVLVLPMDMTVMDVVDVVTVRDRDVTASGAMYMVVPKMLVVQCAGHCFITARTELGFALRVRPRPPL